MRLKTISKYVRNLTPYEYQQCKSLNFRDQGDMLYALPEGRHNGSKVVMIKEGDMLLGWALLTPLPSEHWQFQVYVRNVYRNRGLGKRLLRRAMKISPNLQIIPHDARRAGFFASVDEEFALDPYSDECEPVIRDIKSRRLTNSKV